MTFTVAFEGRRRFRTESDSALPWLLGIATNLLRETDASPALRAAIYKVAATIPGVEVLGPARDHSGRLGIGLAYNTAGARSELIFDPRTSALLGELDTDPAGALVGWAVYLRSRIVNGLPRRRARTAAPACVYHGGRSVQEPDGSTG